MLDGTYGIQMRTPVGPKKGALTLSTQGGLVSGILEILGTSNPITGGKASGNRCRFRGEIKTAFGSVAYEAEGQVDGRHADGAVQNRQRRHENHRYTGNQVTRRTASLASMKAPPLRSRWRNAPARKY